MASKSFNYCVQQSSGMPETRPALHSGASETLHLTTLPNDLTCAFLRTIIMKRANAVAHLEAMGLSLEKSQSDGTWELKSADTVVYLGSDSIQSALSRWEAQQYDLMITKAFLEELVAMSRQWNRVEVEAVIDWLSRNEAPYAPVLVQLRGKTFWPKRTWRSGAEKIMVRHGISIAQARAGIRLEAASILRDRLGSKASNDGPHESSRTKRTQRGASDQTPAH